MTLRPGDAVHVAGLGKGVVREVLNHRKVRVEVKGRQVVASLDQLERVEPVRTAETPRPSTAPADSSEPRNPPARSLDLHGRTVSEALEALAAFLSDALLDGCSEVRIIHGRSGGRIKAAVHARLRAMPSLRFRIDPTNAGVTIVVL